MSAPKRDSATDHRHTAAVCRSEAEARRDRQPDFAADLDTWAVNAEQRAIDAAACDRMTSSPPSPSMEANEMTMVQSPEDRLLPTEQADKPAGQEGEPFERDQATEADRKDAREWLKQRWSQEWPNEGHVRQCADYAAYLRALQSTAGQEGGTEVRDRLVGLQIEARPTHEHYAVLAEITEAGADAILAALNTPETGR